MNFQHDVSARPNIMRKGQRSDILLIDVLQTRRDEYSTGLRDHSLRAIDYKIHHNLLQLSNITFDGGQIGSQVEAQLDVFGYRCLNQRAEFSQKFRQVESLRYKPA